VEVSSEKVEYDVNTEKDINQNINQRRYVVCVKTVSPFESDFYWQFNTVVYSKANDENIPVYSVRVIQFNYSLFP